MRRLSYKRAYAQALIPEPELTVSEWSDTHRILDQVSSSEPGKWRTDRTPYLREIMDTLSASNHDDVIVFMKGAQIGATEAGNNWLGYVIHHAPGPMLYVMPTVETAKRNSKQRIGPMLDGIPEVAEKVATPRARDSGNTLFQKDYPGGTLIITGANSAVGLRSMPARYLFLDEVDAYPSDLDEEGNPIQLAMRRTATYKRNRKVFMVSTPTLKGFSTIEDYFEQSDQRRFMVPCPHCGYKQTIAWKRIKWPEDSPELAYMVCESCDEPIPESMKTRMLTNGEWEPTSEGRYTGFHLSSLYSPAGWYSWGDAATDFLDAKHKGTEDLKTWVNTVLGETWEEEGESVAPHVLMQRREAFDGEIPKAVLALTMGVDVQSDRLEAEIVGWGEGQESWSLEYLILPGDPAHDEVWADLATVIRERYEVTPERQLSIAFTCIDSGYLPKRVYEFCGRTGQHVVPTKGMPGAGRPIVETGIARLKRLRKRRSIGIKPELVGVDEGKILLYRRLLQESAGPGYCHFPMERDEEYFAQLTAEKLVTRYHKGRPILEWVAMRPRNEALDCRVLAHAALLLYGPEKLNNAPEPPKTRLPISRSRPPMQRRSIR